MSDLAKIIDNRRGDSLAARLRRKRFELLLRLLDSVPRPYSVLDVGGTDSFWQSAGGIPDGAKVVLLNLTAAPSSLAQSVAGDARSMPEFADRSFDVVFSNSVIEHVGTFADQRRMADEVQRVAKRYFIQTPNRYFPIEPHFVFPYWQFLPRATRIWMLRHFNLGWFPKQRDYTIAARVVDEIRLLSMREFRQLFPMARIEREKFLGLTKSFTAIGGFEPPLDGGPGPHGGTLHTAVMP